VKEVGVLIHRAMQEIQQSYRKRAEYNFIQLESDAEYHDPFESVSHVENDNVFFSDVLRGDYDQALISVTESNITKSLIPTALLANPNIPQEMIYSLARYSGGLTFSDTVALTTAKYDAATVNELILNSRVNTQKYWIENDKLQSLAILAATNLDYDLFELWYYQSSPIGVIEGDAEIYTRIGIPKNEQEYQSALRILKFISDNTNLIPNWDSINHLKKWADSRLIETMFPSPSNKVDTSWEPSKISETGNSQNLSELSEHYGDCIAKGNEFESFEHLVDAIRLSDHKYVESELLVNSPHINFLTRYPHEINQLLYLVQESRWDESLILADEINEIDKLNDVYSFLVEIFITLKSPEHYINEVIERGANIRPEFMLETVLLNDLDQLQILDSIGTDWKFTSNGLNALHIASAYNVDQKLFDFLVEKGVPVIQDNRGLSISDYLN